MICMYKCSSRNILAVCKCMYKMFPPEHTGVMFQLEHFVRAIVYVYSYMYYRL